MLSYFNAPRQQTTVRPIALPTRWYGALFLLITILQRETNVVPLTFFLPLLGVCAAFAIWRARAQLRSFRNVIVAGVLFAGSLVFAAGAFVLTEDLRSVDRFLVSSAPVIAAWTFFLLVLPAGPPLQPHQSVRDIPHRYAGGWWWFSGLAVGTFVLLAIAHWLIQANFVTFFDEPLYTLQSRLMREPGFVRQIDESLSPFFVLSRAIFREGRLYTQYPPGQPWMLAAFDAAGLRWWTGVIASTAGVLFTYLLGREAVSEFAGRVAALMLATNELFVVYGTGYMAHGTSLACATAAAWLTLRAAGSRGWWRVAGWLAAGMLLGFTVATRPLTGGAISLSIVLWHVLVRKPQWRELVAMVAVLALGSAGPVIALLHYNDVTNGSAFRFGYQVAHGSLHDFGFGTRGFVVPDERGQWTSLLTDFNVRRAVGSLFFVTSELARFGQPALLLVPPLMLLCRRYRHPVRAWPVAVFLVLPVVHFFYFYSHSRFYLELFPFAFVGVAAMIACIRTEHRSLANCLVATILIGQLLATGFDIHRRAVQWQTSPGPAAFAAVNQARQTFDKVLVFVHGNELLYWMAWLNIDDFPGDIIVARDLGEGNKRLMLRFPEHQPLHLEASGEPGRLTLLQRPW